ncbi:hypothetical protein MANES_08G054502v8 [Manihot esculenta]|uniref:Uncharacterized protein n=1 Tax=Manihot esculenta TaxID=3983 RepID=A0ACB7HAI2_MANES|nr:hypothetical protein MANES_08G054502v8 [Manihot esculenta]
MLMQFEMSDLGLLSYYLGIEVRQNSDSITLCQAGYAKKILEKLGLGECNSCSIPMEPKVKMSKHGNGEPEVDKTLYRSVIGSLRYLVNTRPDIAYSVGVVSRYMEAPTTSHLAAVKQILSCQAGTCQGVWLSRILSDISQQQVKPKLNVDNKLAIALAKNSVYHDRSKHIDTRFHFIRQCVQSEVIELEYVNTNEQLADILTKPLARQRFLELREKIGLKKIETV